MEKIYPYPSRREWLERHKEAQAEVESLMNRRVDLASVVKCSLSILALDQLQRIEQILSSVIDERRRGVRQNGKPFKLAQGAANNE